MTVESSELKKQQGMHKGLEAKESMAERGGEYSLCGRWENGDREMKEMPEYEEQWQLH